MVLLVHVSHVINIFVLIRFQPGRLQEGGRDLSTCNITRKRKVWWKIGFFVFWEDSVNRGFILLGYII